MTYFKLFAFIVIAVLISSCGAKEEKVEDLPDNEIVDETLDTNANYEDLQEFVSDNTEEDINPVDSSTKETMILMEDTEGIQIDPPVKEEKKIEKIPVVKEEVKVHQQRYYIVVGSFKQYGNAQKLNKYFKDKGYYPLILPKVNEYNRVAISSYVEEANARKAIKKLRIEHNDLTFWIYKW